MSILDDIQRMVAQYPLLSGYPDKVTIMQCPRHCGAIWPMFPSVLLHELYPAATVLTDSCGCALALPKTIVDAEVATVMREHLHDMARQSYLQELHDLLARMVS